MRLLFGFLLLSYSVWAAWMLVPGHKKIPKMEKGKCIKPRGADILFKVNDPGTETAFVQAVGGSEINHGYQVGMVVPIPHVDLQYYVESPCE